MSGAAERGPDRSLTGITFVRRGPTTGFALALGSRKPCLARLIRGRDFLEPSWPGGPAAATTSHARPVPSELPAPARRESTWLVRIVLPAPIFPSWGRSTLTSEHVVNGGGELTIAEHLLEKPYRCGQLCRTLLLAPPRILTRQLRELEEDGIIRREVYAQVPPKVENSLTPLGDSSPNAPQGDRLSGHLCYSSGIVSRWSPSPSSRFAHLSR